MDPELDLETATPEDVADYVLEVLGLPERYCQAFIGKSIIIYYVMT